MGELRHEGRAWGSGDGRARVRGTDSGNRVRVEGGSGGRTWVRGRGRRDGKMGELRHEGRAWGPGDGRARVRGTDSRN